ncbi:hypothetical protein PseudUWO311_01525 [Pseudanabaena sp. UWO311]|uniref:STM4504/CBY_0614 family protein n=1 Tax=Pseudanabaena sp. UWO311 TaxID=2487337 RepID=UPI00115A96C4|nr:hypothetical protein [Pseudanabaena sp. UWO311]TYQ29606.1 hypothetical protein PseudUWO311_01525 [Pseudanabaena sp. UWO311]
MAIVNLYSKRKKAIERITQPEVYQYTDLPIPFRRQVIYIWETAIGLYNGQISSLARNVWASVYKSLTRELGLLILAGDQHPESSFEQCRSFFLNQATHTDNLLDLIELTFFYIEHTVPKLFEEYRYADELLPQTSEEAIEELNHRFLEHGIGYQYNNGQIIRIDSVFLHAEAVVPALTLISSEGFSGAEQEFRSAHDHYRNQEYKAAIVESLKAFESTMKTICDKFSWAYDKTATASKLIDTILKREELVPSYLQTHFSGLKQVLEAGVPTVRNKTSGHGQGSETKEVPEYLAAYVLHLTASNIVLLVEAYKAKRSEVK